MKTLIRIDFPVQLFIAIASLVAACLSPMAGFCGLYFVLGGWQLLMAIAYLFLPWNNLHWARQTYQIALLAVIFFNGLVLLFMKEEGWILAYGMLFLGPVMALWNLVLSYHEGQNLKKEHTVWDVV